MVWGNERRQQAQIKPSRMDGYPEHRDYSNLFAATPFQLGIRSLVALRPFREEMPWRWGFWDQALPYGLSLEKGVSRDKERQRMSAKTPLHHL